MSELHRGQTAVCIPAFGALELLSECLESVVRHTAAEVPLLVADDATPGEEVAELVARVSGAAGRAIEHLRQPENRGFVENVNAALDQLAPADVVVLNSDCVVTPGWLDGLRAAADTDTRIATVTALADNATIASVPEASGRPAEDAGGAVRAGSLRLRPRLPTAIGHCFLVRRTALELVGGFDTAFSPGYGEEVDFSQRCLLHGLIHVLADDVYVEHRGAGSFSDRAQALQRDHDAEVERRYPWYAGSVRQASEGALGDAVSAARRSLRPLTVTIDGSALGPQTMGTQVTTIALTRALAERDDVRVRVALPPAPGELARSALSELGVEQVPVDLRHERSDVVHRPAQVVNPVNLDWLHRLGERIVITHQDLIAYSNPGYFDSFEDWDEHRALARQSLAFADAAVFISEHVRAEALAEELVESGQAVVVPQGVDHAVPGGARPSRPRGAPDGEFLVLLGADFRHKNRVFALRMWEAMRSRGFGGSLVLAGPHVEPGSSLADEERLPSEGVVRLGEVSEPEKAWLYENAALALYPTVSEGFGLVPFEAAAFGTACMFAPVSSLAEVLEPTMATLVPWDADASADRALGLLGDSGARERLVRAVAERGERYTWALTAERLVEVYRDVLRHPARPARTIYFGGGLSDVAMSLTGPGGLLPPDVQRALLGIAARPRLRAPVFAALRAGRRLRRKQGGDGD